MRRFAKPVYGVNLYRGFESRPLRSNGPAWFSSLSRGLLRFLAGRQPFWRRASILTSSEVDRNSSRRKESSLNEFRD
jgi:hypothetical protein